MDHRRYKKAADGVIRIFQFIFSLVSQTCIVSKFGRLNDTQQIKSFKKTLFDHRINDHHLTLLLSVM